MTGQNILVLVQFMVSQSCLTLQTKFVLDTDAVGGQTRPSC